MTITYVCPTPPHTPPPPIRSLPSPTTAASLTLCIPPPCLIPHSDHQHRISAPPTTPLQPRLRAPSRRRPPHLNRSRRRKWQLKQISRQLLRLQAPSPLCRPLLICWRPSELRPRREPRHLPRHPRLHPCRPLPLARRHCLPGQRPRCSQRTQTALFAASAATAITTFGGTTTVLCATEAKLLFV
jgi:hypothetical protein